MNRAKRMQLVDQDVLLSFAQRVMSDADDLISLSEAARLRGSSVQNVSRLVDHGRIPSMVVAGRRLLRRADVIAFNRVCPMNLKKITRQGKQAKRPFAPSVYRKTEGE